MGIDKILYINTIYSIIFLYINIYSINYLKITKTKY
jgi:hypothetical protein